MLGTSFASCFLAIDCRQQKELFMMPVDVSPAGISGALGAPTRKMTDSIIKVAIVDDHSIVRSGLTQFLSEMVDLRVVGEAASGREAIDLVRTAEIDVLILDLSMPGQSGIDALAMIRAKAPDVGILILSGYPEEQYAV